jgi:hypothetical protein
MSVWQFMDNSPVTAIVVVAMVCVAACVVAEQIAGAIREIRR